MSERRDAPPHDLDVEVAVLGCAMLGPSIVPKLATDFGLRPDHFFRQQHGHIWKAIVTVSDRGVAPDAVTVCEELDRVGLLGGTEVAAARVHSLGDTVPIVGNWGQYARSTIELAQLRRIRLGAFKILEGVAARDYGLVDDGEIMLARSTDVERRTSEPDQLAEELWQQLENGDGEKFPWPYPRLNKLSLGGLRRGQLALIAGWPKHGKSVFLDQCLESFAADGLRVHLFINEMTRRERTERTVARLSKVSYERIALNNLEDPQRQRVVRALDRIPFGITDCSGWSAQDVAREVRRNRYDIVGIDILNRFPKASERKDIEEISRVLNELAKPSQGNCTVLLAAHLNRNRVGQSPVLPFPSIGDLRESAMLVNDADFTVFVWREQDEDTGEALPAGVIRIAAARRGRPGGLPVTFSGDFMEFQAGAPLQAATSRAA